MKKLTALAAALLVAAAALNAASFGEIIRGQYEGNIEFATDTVTGTTKFTVPDLMDDGFAFYFDQDYCSNVNAYLHLQYHDVEKGSFDALVLKANGKEYVIELYSVEGVFKKGSNGYEGSYNSYYKSNTVNIVDAFEDPNLEIGLRTNGKLVMLDFDYDLNKEIVEAYKSQAKYRGYF